MGGVEQGHDVARGLLHGELSKVLQSHVGGSEQEPRIARGSLEQVEIVRLTGECDRYVDFFAARDWVHKQIRIDEVIVAND
jgi:hypothetical protein